MSRAFNRFRLNVFLRFLYLFFLGSYCSIALADHHQKPIVTNFNSIVSFTAEEQVWINKHPVVRYGAEKDWAPYDFVNQQDEHDGFTHDFLELIEQVSGVKFVPVIEDWNELIKKAKDGQVDLLPAIYNSSTRAEFLSYTQAYQSILEYFFIRDDVVAETLEDLNGKTVAIPKDYLNIDVVKKQFPKILILEVDNLMAAIKSVIEHRADLLLDAHSVISYQLKKNNITTIHAFKARPGENKNLVMAVTKEATVLVNILNKSIAVIPEDKKQLLQAKWFGYQPKKIETRVTLNEQERKWLNSHSHIRLGVESGWGPFEFVNQDGQLRGLSADILKLVEKRLKIKFKVIPEFSWAQTLEKLKNNDVDMVSSIVKTPDREQYLLFSNPYYSPPTSIFTRKDSFDITSLKDLKDKTVVIENQYYIHERLAKDYKKMKLLVVKTTVDALKALSYGKADAYIGNQGAANWIAQKNSLTNLKVVNGTDFGSAPLRFAVRQDWLLFQSILNKTLASITNSELASIRRKWLGKNPNKIKLSLSVSERSWLNKHKTIRFTGDPNWLPYEAFDKQGNYIGIVADHLKLIEQKLGIDITIIPSSSWRQAVDKAKQGLVDILSETLDSDLKTQLIFTEPYLSSPIVIVMKNNEIYVENIDQIAQQKIAIIREYGYSPKIIKKHPQLAFNYVNTIQEGLIAVSTGKVDALLATLAQASYHIFELGINNVRIVGKTEFDTKVAFGMQQEFAPLIPLFNRALSGISEGEKQAIFKKWGRQQYLKSTDYDLLTKIAVLFLLILAVVFYWNRKLAKEIELRKEAEVQTQTLIDNIPLEVIVTSLEGKVITANPKVLTDYKIHNEEIDQFNMSDFYNDKSDREKLVNELREKGKVNHKIIKFKKLDGIVRSMMLSIMPITYQNKSAFLTIAVDMTERLEMEAALKGAKENAERATRVKSEFLSNMSHEIRTPMNAIIGFTELLNEQVKEPKLKSFVKTIQSAGNNLLALINDILDLSKIEAGKVNIKKTACNPHDLFSELGNIFMLKMREKNIDFILDIDPLIPKSLQIDAIRLRQVLFNLLGNAVKFTDHGYVRVQARSNNDNKIHSKLDLVIDVIDSGIGISEDQQQLVFQDFEQSSGQDVRKYGGTGLGLSISKKLVELMGGEIRLNSKLGKGSTFTIKLTDVYVAPLAEEFSDAKPKLNKAISFLPANILIVDDVADNRDLLLANFADTALQTAEAENGLEAVKLAKLQQFDLILMDIRMSVMNGYQAAAEIKSFSSTPIVALTASVMTNEFERLKSDNFNGYLRKPVLKAELTRELSKFLPYEKIEIATNKSTEELLLADEEREFLSLALDKLETLSDQYMTISKTNSISEIQAFADAIKEISILYPLSVIANYAEQLMSHIDSFDIAAIKSSLNEYPQLIQQLIDLDKGW